MNLNKKFKKINILQKVNFSEHNILYALIAIWIIFYFTNKSFGSLANIMSILGESATIGIAAIGMTLCIISKNFDLSIGSMIALISIEIVWMVEKLGVIPALIIGLISGFLIGIFNGFMVAKIKIPSFIVTLATFYIIRAVAFTVSMDKLITSHKEWFIIWGNDSFLRIPISFLFFILLAIIGTIILRITPFGRYVLAIGNSEKASRIAGINIANVKILVFGLVGLFTAIAAFFVSSKLNSANATMLNGYEFKVIAAVVLGGTALSGGRGSIFNTFISAIFFATLNDAMVVFRIPPLYNQIIIGSILILAFSIGTIRLTLGGMISKLKLKKS
jgi:ribose transport system permease protein